MELRFSYVAGGGGSQEWAVASLGVHTPKKIRAQFQGCKHTSLAYMISKSWEVGLTLAHNHLRNVCRNAWQTVVL